MENTKFDAAVGSLFEGMDSLVSTKTVVGDAITVGDTVIVPLVDVSFGMGAGSFSKDKKDSASGGLGGKIQPCAVLVIKDGATRMLNVRNQDVASKIVDMVPDILAKFQDKKKEPEVDIDELVDEAAKEADKQ